MTKFARSLVSLMFVLVLGACNSSSLEDAIDLAEGVPRKDIDTSKLGVNAFVNDGRFGTIDAQFGEVRNTLRLGFVRVLFAWNDAVQPSPDSAPNFSFYDQIASSIPPNVDALVVITGLPSWMANPANWINGNPRATFVERWVKRVTRRYANNSRIVGWQLWNEPNNPSDPDNTTLGVLTNPVAYVELLALGANAAKDNAPAKAVLNGATTAINQNFPETINYNEALRDAGAQSLVDVYAIHYYGRQFENVLRGGGVEDFLDGLSRPIWVTESGAQGVNNQLAYGEQVFPFLIDKVPGIQRIYYYQFTEATPADVTYGLRNLTAGASVSDLYVWLRDRP